ncbi:O-antigen ligase family protein [candidate division WWE3 bacterium]|uniref:O-antigen ligase family protein n=1 Tax=candidate division WWE3 bacterium TaxID=2053526 RepID=A0A928TTZ3_UNCKA|nr:O-antigen ligase family protein [candidate division WWE3 bacterium]
MDDLLIGSFLAALLWGVISWKWPKRAFAFLPLLLPSYVVRLHLGPIPTTLLELLLLATFIGWFMRRGRLEAWMRATLWRWPVILWLTAGLVAVLVSPVTAQALGLYRAYFIEPLLIFFMGLDLIRTREDKAMLAKTFAVAVMLLGIWSAAQFFTGWMIPSPWNAWPGRRAVGPFPFPNALALFVTPVIALLFADAIADHQGAKAAPLLGTWISAAGILAGLSAILFARSDGGFIAFLAAACIALVMKRRTRWIALVIAVAGMIAVFASPLRGAVVERFTFQEWSGQVRVILWKESIAMLRDRPIFGAGLAAYPTVILPYHKATFIEVFQYPHNILLNLWSETGIFGVIAFLYILGTWIRFGKDSLPVTLPVIAALLVHGLVDVPYFKNDLAVAFWLLTLLTTATPVTKKMRGEHMQRRSILHPKKLPESRPCI